MVIPVGQPWPGSQVVTPLEVLMLFSALRRVKLTHQLGFGFGLMLLLMVVTLGANLAASTQQQAITVRLINHLYPARLQAHEIIRLALAIDDNGAWYVLTHNSHQQEQLLQSYQQEAQALRAAVAKATALADTPGQRGALVDFTQYFFGSGGYIATNQQAFSEKLAGQDLTAGDSFVGSPFLPDIQLDMQVYTDVVEREIKQAVASGDAVARQVQLLDIGLGGSASLFGIGIALLFTRSIGRLYREIEEKNVRLAENNTRLQALATTDPLTGLPNHRAYQEALQQTLEHVQQRGEQAALALINVDELKEANDTHGHLYGDHLLVELASLLAASAPEAAFRLRGDEFALLLPKTSLAQARESLEHLRQEAEKHLLGSTISIGLAITTAEEQEIELLREQADAALHEAKRQGRNALISFEEIRDTTSMLAPLKVQAFRRLLEEQRVKVAFQPIWNMQEGRVMAFEALCRPAPEYGFSGPQEVFDIAEKLGHAHELDYLCVQATLRRARELPAGVLLFLNLTPQTLAHDLLTGAVLVQAVIEAGLTMERVVIELTERSTLPIALVVQKARHLKELGFRLALDDAGAGNAGLEMMSQLAVDFIKIDRMVVVNAMTDKAAHGVLAGIAAIAREMEAFVIAEGIENVEMLEMMRQSSLQAVQGYLLGRPSEVIPELDSLQALSPLALVG